ncbi:MAG: hypothetical protein ACLQK4_12960 [Acidimicrobiales bacterium]
MSDQIIRVTARPRADGIDIDRLALVLLEVAEQLPESRVKPLKTKRKAGGAVVLIPDRQEGAT